MIKKCILLLVLGFSVVSMQSQILTPVKWKSELKTLEGNTYEAIFTAKLDKGWHINSKDLPEGGFALPVVVSFTKKENIELLGQLQEIGEKHDEYSKIFEERIIYYADQVVYKQKFKRLDQKLPGILSANIEFQACDDTRCLAPDTKTFVLNTSQSATGINNNNIAGTDGKESSLKVKSIISEHPLSKDCNSDHGHKDKGNWTILLLGFLGGLLALLTPCVFPMIPLTVSYFTKGHEKGKGKKNAIIYAFMILLIFVALSLPFYILTGIQPDIFNQISTNVWVNFSFFVIFIIFAFSFFGYFDITLPNWIVNRSDHASKAGGLIGIFFMALTLIVVSFSCTGPILGTLLASAIESPQQLTFALGGFGLSWAIIFGGFALFPKVLSSLPKSGGWMNTIKVLLGFIELALAFKFLSKADLVAKTFLIKRELFVAIWIVICVLIILYLLKIIRFPHDDKNEKIGWTKPIIMAVFFGCILYMIPGLLPPKQNQTNLKALSGILPPTYVSYYHTGETCPLGLRCIHDYKEAISLAKQENKAILIDFTGYGCENCRRMEENVWSEPDILQILKEDVVLASLYVDDRTELPENEQVDIKLKDGTVRKIKTIGDKWAVFQRENFNNNAQPFYVLISPNEEVISFPKGDNGYMEKERFKDFLQCGITYFKTSRNPIIF